MNIITSTESIRTTKDILVSAPLPIKTDSYSPVPHSLVINTVLEQLDKAGIRIKNELYTSSRGGNQMKGIIMLDSGDAEMKASLMYHNSYDKTMPLRIAMGCNVIVCENGMVRGDMGAFKRRHTGDILQEFEESTVANINNMGETFKKLVRDRERMKEIEISKKTAARLIGELYISEALVNTTQIAIIKRELDNPSYDYGVDGTLWNTYNAATVALKEAHPMHFLNQHTKLHDYIDNEFILQS